MIKRLVSFVLVAVFAALCPEFILVAHGGPIGQEKLYSEEGASLTYRVDRGPLSDVFDGVRIHYNGAFKDCKFKVTREFGGKIKVVPQLQNGSRFVGWDDSKFGSQIRYVSLIEVHRDNSLTFYINGPDKQGIGTDFYCFIDGPRSDYIVGQTKTTYHFDAGEKVDFKVFGNTIRTKYGREGKVVDCTDLPNGLKCDTAGHITGTTPYKTINKQEVRLRVRNTYGETFDYFIVIYVHLTAEMKARYANAIPVNYGSKYKSNILFTSYSSLGTAKTIEKLPKCLKVGTSSQKIHDSSGTSTMRSYYIYGELKGDWNELLTAECTFRQRESKVEWKQDFVILSPCGSGSFDSTISMGSGTGSSRMAAKTASVPMKLSGDSEEVECEEFVGGDVPSEIPVLKSGETFKSYAKAKPGFVFTGWYQDAACTKPFYNDAAILSGKDGDYRIAEQEWSAANVFGAKEIEVEGKFVMYAAFTPIENDADFEIHLDKIVDMGGGVLMDKEPLEGDVFEMDPHGYSSVHVDISTTSMSKETTINIEGLPKSFKLLKTFALTSGFEWTTDSAYPTPGDYPIDIIVANKSGAVQRRKLTIRVPNQTSWQLEDQGGLQSCYNLTPFAPVDAIFEDLKNLYYNEPWYKQTVSAKGLPPGLKLAKDGTMSGAPTKPGRYTTTFTVTSTGGGYKYSEKKTVEIIVNNIMNANDLFMRELDNAPGETYTLSVGERQLDMLPNLSLADTASKLSVSGLPSGLKYNAATGLIEGVAMKAGWYTVTLTVQSGKTKTISTITLKVDALPGWAYGTFNGGVLSDPKKLGSVCGLATITISNTGKISGKILKDGLSWTLSATCFESYDNEGYHAILTAKCGKEVDKLNVTITEMGIEGDGIIAYQNLWKTTNKLLGKNLAARYKSGLPLTGNQIPNTITSLSCKFAASGAVSAKATVEGGNVSCSSVLIDTDAGDYLLYLYFAPNDKIGFAGEGLLLTF